MALPLFSQTITTLKPNPSSLTPNTQNTLKRNPNFTIIKADLGNGDQAHRANIKTQQKPQQPMKKRIIQAQPIGLWDRFPTARTVQQMMDTMDRLAEDPPSYNNRNVSAWSSPVDTTTPNRGRTPWEIKEGDQDYKLRFDMPGMTKQDVKVYVEETMLVIKAEKIAKEENDEDEEWSGKSFGKYSFRILLPENIQFENIKAEVKDGVLYVTIPKALVTPKILDINVQ